MAADDTTDTPRSRLTAAAAGLHKMAYARVMAGDVVEVGKTVKTHTRVTRDLVAGAENAIAERVTATDPGTIEVFQLAGQVRELLEAATDAEANPVPEGA